MNNLETGDILLFSGTKSILDRLIEYFTISTWSHVGIVLKDPDFLPIPLKGYYLWESCDERFGDSETSEFKFGVEIADLKKVLDESKGNQKIYYRKVNFDKSVKENIKSKLLNIYNETLNKPYDIVPKDWVDAYVQKDKNPQKTDRYFCSALTGYIFTKLGCLKEDTDWSIMRPCDFDIDSKYQFENMELGGLIPIS
jgi:hypothetical protein